MRLPYACYGAERTAKNSLANNNPQRWLAAASMFLAGSMRCEEGVRYAPLHRRINIVKTCDDRVFRQEHATSLDHR